MRIAKAYESLILQYAPEILYKIGTDLKQIFTTDKINNLIFFKFFLKFFAIRDAGQ